jgi:hypothetical protein
MEKASLYPLNRRLDVRGAKILLISRSLLKILIVS